MRPPAKWVRRFVIAPIVVVLGIVALATTPLVLLLFLALISLVPGHVRTLRVIWLAFVYLIWDAAALVVLFVLWIASGFGWKIRGPLFQRVHYRVAALALRVLFWVFGSSLRLTIATSGAEGPEESADRRSIFAPGIPLVVASRHAGPGDSFILIHLLLNQAHRMPRIVLAQKLQWDPAVDVLLSRIPSRFIAPAGFGPKRTGGGAAVEAEIGRLATGMDGDDALVIFPEGGNFTDRRRKGRIDRLRASGREDMAARAESFGHVMAPHPGGVHAALAAGDADIVFVAHTGLEDLVTLGDMWHALPMDKRITMHAWRVPRSQIPEDLEEQATWLFDWFARIDAWIAAHSDPVPTSGADAAE